MDVLKMQVTMRTATHPRSFHMNALVAIMMEIAYVGWLGSILSA